MSLLPWRAFVQSASPRNIAAEPGHAEAVPGVPLLKSPDKTPQVNGHQALRTTYARRDEPPPTNAATRMLAGTMHGRVSRIGQARDLMGQWQDRVRGRKERDIRHLGPLAGEELVRWTLDNVLNARRRPAPSFGFSLPLVLTHSVAARRQLRFRGAVIVGMVGLVTVRHPLGAMALVVLALLRHYLLTAGLLRALVRWGFSSIVPLLLVIAGGYMAWSRLRPHTPVLAFAVQDSVAGAVWMTLLLTIAYTVDRWTCLAYLASLGPWHRTPAARPRLAPRASARIAECEVSQRWQSIPYRKEDGINRFVGAGLDAWRATGPRIQLTAARRAEDEEGDARSSARSVPQPRPPADADSWWDEEPVAIRKFEADELLDKVRDELERLSGVLVETHSLPHCDIFETLAVPQSRWKKLPRRPGRKAATQANLLDDTWPEAQEMIEEGGRAPSGHHSRRYLAAQVVDWKGDIVVTVFAHAALEGKTLHFVTRPHVLAPVKDEARAESATGRELVEKILLTPVHALGDTAALARRSHAALIRGLDMVVGGLLGRSAQQQVAAVLDKTEQKDIGEPVSLREYCALDEPEDMHQVEDAARHISILQSRMFSTVSAFLDDHGVYTGDFRRQAQEVVAKIFINGDHNQVNTGTMHGGQTQTTQNDSAPTKG
ncbi:hypothetical protein [Streptomyces bambusae]|uniref:hypothetical protein n=1 Tax=Streptomyces bambusae TaxID=1550616 RepID=UPI0021553703|nr:hypothetical protein [Streptomyces bambusae]